MMIRLFLLLVFVAQTFVAPVIAANGSVEWKHELKKSNQHKSPFEKKDVNDTDEESDEENEVETISFFSSEFNFYRETVVIFSQFGERERTRKATVFCLQPIIIWVQNFRI